MMFIGPFSMSSQMSYHGTNPWLEVMVLLTRCVAKCAQPLKVGKEYWQPSWIPCINMWGEKKS
jgi:hypothetical protein